MKTEQDNKLRSCEQRIEEEEGVNREQSNIIVSQKQKMGNKIRSYEDRIEKQMRVRRNIKGLVGKKRTQINVTEVSFTRTESC